jgi:hypothetical protein
MVPGVTRLFEESIVTPEVLGAAPAPPPITTPFVLSMEEEDIAFAAEK